MKNKYRVKKIVLPIAAMIALATGCNSSNVIKQNLINSQDGIITIEPKDKVYAEVTVTNGRIAEVTQIESILSPEKTITFEFSETKHGTMLSVQNPFDQPIKYSINMVDYSGNFHKTSSCPVMAGGGAFESWPHPIPQIVISDFRFLEDGQGFTCTYYRSTTNK